MIVVTAGEAIIGSGDKTFDVFPTPTNSRVMLRGYNTHTPILLPPSSDHSSNLNQCEIVACVSGQVEVIESVISVRGLCPRYQPEVGDVVVGRILSVIGNRWSVDIGTMLDSTLALANVTDPGGLLRRRNRGDELTMRSLFTDGDIVVAEVQRISVEGHVHLHTRNDAQKYGKMSSGFGVFLQVKPFLMRRTKRPFYLFASFGVRIVFGANGAVWVSVATQNQINDQKNVKVDTSDDEDGRIGQSDVPQVSYYNALKDRREMYAALARAANIVRILDQHALPIVAKNIKELWQQSLRQSLKPFDVLRPEVAINLVAVVRRSGTQVIARELQKKRDRPE